LYTYLLYFKNPLYIVDTPGIGTNEHFDDYIMEFLPHAAGLVYVVNVFNAGGVQRHGVRLCDYLEELSPIKLPR